MNLKELKAKGGFVDPQLVEKQVTWEHKSESGEPLTDTFTVFVRRHSFGMVEKLFLIDKEDESRSRLATFISESVFLGEKGKEPLSYVDAYQLESSLARSLINAIHEVNGTAESAPKN